MLILVFLLDKQRYGLAIHSVDRVLPMVVPVPLPGAPAIVSGVINLHGTVVPVLDIRRRLGRPSRDYGIDGWLLVVQTATRLVAFPVDTAVGVEELEPGTVTPPATLAPGVEYISGIAPTPDGLLLIHDAGAFLSLDEEAVLRQSVAEVQR